MRDVRKNHIAIILIIAIKIYLKLLKELLIYTLKTIMRFLYQPMFAHKHTFKEQREYIFNN